MTQTEMRRLALELPPEERVDLAVELWDSLGQEVPIPQWHLEVVRQRIETLDQQDPEERSKPWAEVRARLLGNPQE